VHSYPIGRIVLDPQQLQSDMHKLKQFELSNIYDDYAYGDWKTCILWNRDGKARSDLIHIYNGHAIPTEIGIELNYLSGIIEQYFSLKYLKFARIFLFRKNGLIIPHRDFIELHEQYTRIHIPIHTELSCLSSEEDTVFHMRKGEVWFLEANKIHSAACFSNSGRYHLVLDFMGNIPISQLISPRLNTKVIPLPKIIKRPRITQQYLSGLYNLGDVICHENFRHITSILAKVHFKKEANAAAMFQWLLEIAKRSKQSDLLERAKALYTQCIIARDM